MKIDPHDRSPRRLIESRPAELAFLPAIISRWSCFLLMFWIGTGSLTANQPDPAHRLLARVIEQIALGPAFDAKVRQRVWVGGREVIGVGTYEQAGNDSGWFNLQVAMHDGDGKHTLQQISDGRLAWTREQIGQQVTLQRVDVGRLDQWVVHSSENLLATPVHRENDSPGVSIVDHLRPSVRVGGWCEMLESVAADHDLKIATGLLEDREVWIVRGSLRADVRAQRLEQFGVETWPELCPTQVVIAIAKAPHTETDFGQGLPLRIEFWTDPVVSATNANDVDSAEDRAAPVPNNSGTPVSLGTPTSLGTPDSLDTMPGTRSPAAEQHSQPDAPVASTRNSRLISLIELYSIRPISSPPIGRFRFENQDMEVNFTNSTDRYLSRYGIQITERQSRMLRR